jgi:hypothetical protein
MSIRVEMPTYCDCGERLYRDCFGRLRCILCNHPCPCCHDGEDEHTEEDDL